MRSIFSTLVFFSASTQLFTADNNHGHAAKKSTYNFRNICIEEIKLEVALCAPDCPQDVVNILGDYIQKNTVVIVEKRGDNWYYVPIKTTKLKRKTILA
jgi:hypothetical protein